MAVRSVHLRQIPGPCERPQWVSRACLGALILLLGGCGSDAPGAGSPAAMAYADPAGETVTLVDRLPPPRETRNGIDRPIMEGDVLEIDVFRADEFDRTVQVDETGFISLPLVPPVEAKGLTVRALEARLEGLWSAYLQTPDVSVFLRESTGRNVTVDGEVRRAGVFPAAPGMSLTRAIALAGGLAEIADPGRIYVFRTFGKARLVANVDLGAVREGRLVDPPIYAGDTVVVFGSSGRIALRNLKDALGLASSGATLAVLP